MVDWNLVNEQWGDIMSAARRHRDMQADVAYDDKGRVFTTARPMIETMICERTDRSERLRFYLDLLGFRWTKGRVIDVNIRDRMPLGSGGKGKRCRK